MSLKSICRTASIATGAVVLMSSPAFATTIPIPEPSMLSIYGAGLAGLVIAGRWLRRK